MTTTGWRLYDRRPLLVDDYAVRAGIGDALAAVVFGGIVKAFDSEVDCGDNQCKAQDGCDNKAFIDFGYSVFAVAC